MMGLTGQERSLTEVIFSHLDTIRQRDRRTDDTPGDSNDRAYA